MSYDEHDFGTPLLAQWYVVGATGPAGMVGLVLTVEDAAPAIIEAIERAARENGVELERVDQ